MKLKPINEQVVVVFGASSGIGRQTALRFAQRGARVVVAARGAAGLQSLVDEITRDGGEATAITADVTDFAQVKAVADGAVARYGRLDTWVHAAAVAIYALFDSTTPEEFKQVIDVNLTGQAYGAMAALPHLKREGRGALIHISSVEGRRAYPYHSAYGASKHGVVALTEALRVELMHEHWPISVTNIMPASINTPFFNKARTKLGVKPAPPPPIYQPSLVADAILFAAEHPTRDLIVGGAGRVQDLSQKFAPGLLDALLAVVAFKAQQTDEPKSSSAPSSLFGPIAGFDRVEGDFTAGAQAISPYTWLRTRPALRRGLLAGLAVGTVAAGRARARLSR